MESPGNKKIQNLGDEFGRLNVDMATLVEQKWQNDAAQFRAEFDRFLDMVPADKQVGWAYYDYSYRVDDADDFHTREVVLARIVATGDGELTYHTPNLIKIVTNETFEVNGMTQCLSEEIFLDYENDSWYYTDAKVLKGNDPEDMLVLDDAQVFVAKSDDDVGFLNPRLLPPSVLMHDPNGEVGSVIPFGLYNSRGDGDYVLKKGWEVLEGLRQEYPKYRGSW